ncbi:MAG TPA: CoA-transferase [Burkholderiaceae bacterium]
MLASLDELAASVPDGTRLAIAKEDSGAAVAAALALARRGVRDLHLVCVPVSGIEADLLIGAGCVARIETSAVSLGEFGPAPRFVQAVRSGQVQIVDATCPAIYAGLQAGQKGIPFIPLRGIVGSSLLEHRSDWRVIENPFADGDRIVAISAIVPDVALFHAPAADRHGNVFLGRDRDGLLLAHASRRTLVTVEHVVEGNLLEDEARAGAVLPALYVHRIAHAPRGAWPAGFPGHYGPDAAAMTRYAGLARSDDGFARALHELHAGHARA